MTDKKKETKKEKKINRFRFWYLVIKYKIKYMFSNPLYNKGVHFYDAPSGTGKTLLANIVMRTIVNDDKSFMYTNVDQFDKDKTYAIDFFSMFEEGKQEKRLATRINDKYCKGIIIDELNANFNRRLNNRSSYNNVFVGMMQWLVTARHQGIDRVLFIGQDLSLQDGQVQQVFKYRHLIYAKNHYSYALYKDKKKIRSIPKKLKIVHEVKSNMKDARGMPIFIAFKTTKMKINYKEHMTTYNHLGYADQFANLPIIAPNKR